MTIDLEKFKLTPEQQSQKKKEIVNLATNPDFKVTNLLPTSKAALNEQ